MGKICEFANSGKWQKPVLMTVVVVIILMIIGLTWYFGKFTTLGYKMSTTIILGLFGAGIGAAVYYL